MSDTHDDDIEIDINEAFHIFMTNHKTLLDEVIRPDGWKVTWNNTSDIEYRAFDEEDVFKLKGTILNRVPHILELEREIEHVSFNGREEAEIKIAGPHRVQVDQNDEVIIRAEFCYKGFGPVRHKHTFLMTFNRETNGDYKLSFKAREKGNGTTTHHDQGGGVPK